MTIRPHSLVALLAFWGATSACSPSRGNEVALRDDFEDVDATRDSQIPAMVRRIASKPFALTNADRNTLAGWAKSRTLAARVVARSRIILTLADGRSVRASARACGVAEATVRLWRDRFEAQGAKSLLADAPGRGRKPTLDPALRHALGVAGRTATLRETARRLGVSPATVSRWRKRS